MTTNKLPAIGSSVDILGENGRPDNCGKVVGYDYCPEYLAWFVVVSMTDGQTWYCDPINLITVQ
jgi:hypothetical protein